MWTPGPRMSRIAPSRDRSPHVLLMRVGGPAGRVGIVQVVLCCEAQRGQRSVSATAQGSFIDAEGRRDPVPSGGAVAALVFEVDQQREVAPRRDTAYLSP